MKIVKLADFVLPGDNIFWVGRTKNPIMRFILKAIRWFSKSWSSHVIKVRKPDLYQSVTTPKPEELNDIGVWEHADELWIRRPVAQFLITEKALERMDELWRWVKDNTEYDELQLCGIMLTKILIEIGIKVNSPAIEENAENQVCSSYCSFIDCEALNFDPVPLTADSLTDPGMLERTKTYSNVIKLRRAKEKGTWTTVKKW